MKLKIDYVDDSSQLLAGVKFVLENASLQNSSTAEISFDVDIYRTVASYQNKLQSGSCTVPDVILLDIVFDNDPQAGMRLIKGVRKVHAKPVIVMFSQFDDAETIADYMANGADNFVSKSTPSERLAEAIYRSYEIAVSKRQIEPSESIDENPVVKVVGKTQQQIVSRVPGILNSAVRAVHVYGETGTGKEVVADIFSAFIGTKQSFLRINCGALSPALLESELFGYKKGAFTGALADKVGLLEMASGGWLFLDEVALLSAPAQVALLRAIENQEIIRVGENRERKIDVRIISATNQQLSECVHQGGFRRDLWQRLREIEIFLPPLRQRQEEIPDLALHIASEMAGGPYTIPSTVIEVFKKYSWSQGNIRELRNCLRAMTEFHIDKVMEPSSIPKFIFEEIGEKQQESDGIVIKVDWENIDYENLEKQLFQQVLKTILQSGKISSMRALEKKINIPRTTLSKKIRGMIGAGELNPAQIQGLLRIMGRNSQSEDNDKNKED